MPVRRIPRSHRNLTGVVSPGPGRRGIACESPLERDFVILTLFDPDVVEVEEQPVRVPLPGGRGRAAYYVPDFLVRRRMGGTSLVEVKPSQVLAAEGANLEPKFAAARGYAAGRRWSFEVWTEREIRTVRLDNAKFLLPYRSRATDPGLCLAVMRAVAVGAESVAGVVAKAEGERERGRWLACLWHLLATGRLATDLGCALDMDSRVMAAGGGRDVV